MNQADLIHEVAVRSHITKKESAIVVKEVLNVIRDAVSHGETVRLIDFGTFTPVLQKEKTISLPQTQELVVKPAKFVAKFKAGKLFKKLVDDNMKVI